MKLISVREHPEMKEEAIAYFQKCWPSVPPEAYRESITEALSNTGPLPQWYLLMKADEIIGCAGLIRQEFITRTDLCPYICALYIEPDHRGNRYGGLLLEQAKKDASLGSFEYLYLVTDHVGYYEKFGFDYFEEGHYPAGEVTRIYRTGL